jgi:hypothetical protein
LTTTLITDDFADEPGEPYEPHNLLYGSHGWTDAVDDATIDLLLKVGAIRFLRQHSGIGWQTRIYVSEEGRDPE